jgi:hypothetical protein
MKAPIESSPSWTLEEVAEHFEQWRRGKKKGERIPQQLWSEAVDLVGTYGISQVTRTLRLSGRDLNERRGIIGEGRRRQGRGGKTAFVEVEPGVVNQALTAEPSAVWMELERPDGWRLRIQPSGGVELLALVERFMRT